LKFITDMGESSMTLGRYGVWEDKGPGTATVIDVDDDLETLQSKHGPNLRVIDLALWRKERT
jgi:hypothetical protein